MEKCSVNGQPADAIIAFDSLYTTNHIQMLKLLFPYLDMEQQHKLAAFIKWQELQYTLNFMEHHPSCPKTGSCQKKEPNFDALLPILSPYCSDREKNLLSQLGQMLSLMNNLQDMLQYLPMLQEMMGAFAPSGGSGPFGQGMQGNESAGTNGMLDMLKNMLTPEQQSMLSMFMEGGIP